MIFTLELSVNAKISIEFAMIPDNVKYWILWMTYTASSSILLRFEPETGLDHPYYLPTDPNLLIIPGKLPSIQKKDWKRSLISHDKISKLQNSNYPSINSTRKIIGFNVCEKMTRDRVTFK